MARPKDMAGLELLKHMPEVKSTRIASIGKRAKGKEQRARVSPPVTGYHQPRLASNVLSRELNFRFKAKLIAPFYTLPFALCSSPFAHYPPSLTLLFAERIFIFNSS